MSNPITREGSRWIELKSGEVFTLSVADRLNADNEPEQVYRLRNHLHFHELSQAELEKNFLKI